MLNAFSSQEDYNKCVKKFFCEQLKNIFECIYFYIFPEEILEKVDYDEQSIKEVSKSLKDGKGAIFLSMHYGNWELLGAFFIKIGFPLSSIYMRPRFRIVDHIINFWRKKHNIGLLEHDNPIGIFKVIKKGEILALISDQDGGSTGVMTEWSGNRISFPSGAVRIYKRLSPPIFGTFIKREKNGRHKVFIRKLEIPEEADSYEKIVNIFITFYNEIIYKKPSQWLLSYDRFKFRTYNRKNRFLYSYLVFFIDFLYMIILILCFPYLFIILKKKKALKLSNLRFWAGIYDYYGKKPAILIHVVSFGEFSNIEFLVNKEKYFVISTPDFSLFEFLSDKYKNDNNIRIIISPLDFSFAVNRLISNFRLERIIFSEVDLWPNLLIFAIRAGIPVYWINARISDKNGFLFKVIPIYSILFKNISIYPKDKSAFEYLKKLGLNINLPVNLKFIKKEYRSGEWNEGLIKAFSKYKIIVIGSSHFEDEKVIFESMRGLLEKGYRFIFLPRNIERVEDILKYGISKGFRGKKVLSSSDINESDFLVIGKMGVLEHFYEECYIAVVGGSFLNLGSHNILEPAFHGKRLITGPYLRNFSEEADMLEKLGILTIVKNADELMKNIVNWPKKADFKKFFELEEENRKNVKIMQSEIIR